LLPFSVFEISPVFGGRYLTDVFYGLFEELFLEELLLGLVFGGFVGGVGDY
jgi:hypothetical protein